MPGQWLFPGRRGPDEHLTTRQYARLVGEWVSGIGLDPLKFATHSMRRTKATLIYRRTGNLRAVQLLLGHTKIESTVRYFGVEVDDALEIAEKIDICRAAVLCPMQYRRVRATSRLIQRGRSDKTLRSISALSAMTRRAFLLTVGFEYTAARRVLNETLFVSLPQTRAVLDAWRGDYNRVRPHSALANRTPEEFRAQHIAVAAAPATVKLYPRTLPMIGGKSGLRSRGYLARVRALPAPTNHINGKWHSAAQLGSAFYGVPSLRNEKPIVECSSPEASKKRRARASYEALAAEAMKNRGARYG